MLEVLKVATIVAMLAACRESLSVRPCTFSAFALTQSPGDLKFELKINPFYIYFPLNVSDTNLHMYIATRNLTASVLS